MRDRLLCLLVILVSANGAVMVIGKEAVYLGCAAILLLYGIFRRVRVTHRDGAIVLAFLAICIAHYMSFGDDVLTASLGFLVRLVIALLATRLVKGFHRHCSEIMVGLSLLSFVFYVPVVLGVDLPRMLEPLRIPLEGSTIFHIGLHNFHTPEEAGRNCGMFGEPGMFAGHIALAMVFIVRDVDRRGSLRWGILTAAMLTSQSTTGYLAMIPLFLARTMAKQIAAHGRVRYLSTVPIAVAAALLFSVAYETLPFLRDKIEHQLEHTYMGTEAAKITRFGNFVYDADYVWERPLLGWSPQHRTRSVRDSSIEELAAGQGNGLSGFAVRFGLLGLTAYLYWAYVGLKSYHQHAVLAVIALGAIAMVLSGEQFLNAPLFLTLMFSPGLGWKSETSPKRECQLQSAHG